ncbi:MAG: aminotransferase class I/II-fold pyridoxal phosphate-dependent enzyme [Deltaproteobacteria bacterium]|nr:aminotransferase class I/II-fold pyridoxal phosphate-dependent enzyme [Deltaproteobacteria bacterium]
MRRNGGLVSLNLNVRDLAPSATVAINDISNELIQSGRVVYKLGLGQSPFPVPASVVEALRANAHHKDYLPSQGLPALREAVARFHQKNDNVAVHPDDVLIGPGSKVLLFLLQLAYYGDLVVPTPCWVSYAPQAQILGRPVHFLPTNFEGKWRLRPEALEELCHRDPGRPRIVILNYPGNPDGTTYRPATLKRIAEVARRHRVIVLSDEIYGKLHHEGRHVSIAQFYPEGTIISSGLSKWCGAGGWRLGTFSFPSTLKRLLETMVSLASETYTAVSAPTQHAAIRAFDGGTDIEMYLVHARRILSALGNWIAGRLRESGVRVVSPEGGFYLFPDFGAHTERLGARGIATSAMMCARILAETGVAFLPGVEFGRPANELTARISYVDFDGARALAAGETTGLDKPLDEEFIATYCHRTYTATKLLCEWVDAL